MWFCLNDLLILFYLIGFCSLKISVQRFSVICEMVEFSTTGIFVYNMRFLNESDLLVWRVAVCALCTFHTDKDSNNGIFHIFLKATVQQANCAVWLHKKDFPYSHFMIVYYNMCHFLWYRSRCGHVKYTSLFTFVSPMGFPHWRKISHKFTWLYSNEMRSDCFLSSL